MQVGGSLMTLVAAGVRIGRDAEPAIPWARIVLAFLFCIGLAVLAIFALRRYQGGRGSAPPLLLKALLGRGERAYERPLHLVDRVRVTATSQLIVLSWAGTRYLILVGASGGQVLDRRDAGPAADESPS